MFTNLDLDQDHLLTSRPPSTHSLLRRHQLSVVSRLDKHPHLLLPSALLPPLRMPQPQLPNPHQRLGSGNRVHLPLAYRKAMALVKALLRLAPLQPIPPLALHHHLGHHREPHRPLPLLSARVRPPPLSARPLLPPLEAAPIQRRSAQHRPQAKPLLLLPPLLLRLRLQPH